MTSDRQIQRSCGLKSYSRPSTSVSFHSFVNTNSRIECSLTFVAYRKSVLVVYNHYNFCQILSPKHTICKTSLNIKRSGSERLQEKCTMPVWTCAHGLFSGICLFTSEKSKTEYTIATNAKYFLLHHLGRLHIKYNL